MKSRYFLALVVCLLAASASEAQSGKVSPAASAQPTPEKVFPVLRENYVSANSDEIFSVGKVTGEIGRFDALYLPKPFYPGDAKRDGAAGKIYVRIEIDERGHVSSARSTEGHAALRKAAEDAARASKFRVPPAADAQAAKTEAWLVYNFEIAGSNWIKIGYDLAFLHTPWINQKIVIAGIKSSFKPDWTSENDMLAQIEERVAQNAAANRPDAPSLITEKTFVKNSSELRGQIAVALPRPPEPDPEQIALTQNLINALQGRLAGDETAFWQFNLAFAILNEAHPPRNPSEPAKPPEKLKNFLRNAPPNLPAAYRTELENLIRIIETEKRNEQFAKIRESIIRLQKIE